MTDQRTSQGDAAIRAADARAAIAKKITSLARTVTSEMEAQMVLHLAQAYAALAAEPPRTRGSAG
jgi:Skp family chaperone for outer membrane proteins